MRSIELKSNHSELDQLKHLLLADELKQLELLSAQLQTLKFESYDLATIKRKLLPLFDDLLLERLEQKDANTLAILSGYLAKIITKSADDDLPALSQSLQRVISPAISKEIADNRDKMVDALYPIIGGMISKYVSNAIAEMVANINTKIEDGLSLQRYKRKLKAKLTGVSESELLLEEASDATIESLFVIQKDTGLLIAEAHIEEKEIDDPHMVASMASAIREFVNDWIESHKESAEVQLLSYGTATLYIESAGSVYLIAFLDAEPDYEVRARINAFFALLISEYSDFFHRFDGDDNAIEIKAITHELKLFLDSANPRLLHHTSPKGTGYTKLLFGMLLLLLLGYGGYRLYGYYQRSVLEQEIQRMSQEPGVKLESDGDRWILKGKVSSLEGYHRLKSALKKAHLNDIQTDIALPIESLEKKIAILKEHYTILTQSEDTIGTKVTQMQQDLAHLRQEIAKIQNRYHQEHERLQSVKSLATIRHYIIHYLQQNFGEGSLLQSDGSLDFRSKRLFEAGEAVPKAVALPLLKETTARYLQLLMNNPKIQPLIKGFVIEGYSDSSGNQEANRVLSLKRAEAIREVLLKSHLFEQYGLDEMVQVKGLGDAHLVMHNGNEDKEASRRIKLKFEIDTQKVVNMIESSIQ